MRVPTTAYRTRMLALSPGEAGLALTAFWLLAGLFVAAALVLVRPFVSSILSYL